MGNRKLLELICLGDSYGAPFEFNTSEFIEKHNDLRYHDRMGKIIKTPAYTDDGQMSIALVEYMLSDEFDLNVIKPEVLAEHFFHAYYRDKRGGYSKRMMQLYKTNAMPTGKHNNYTKLYYDGFHLDINKFADQRRNSNGCVMRVLPISMLSDPAWVMDAALQQCIITHPTVECIMATQMLALFGHYLYHTDLNNNDILDILEKKIPAFGSIMDSWKIWMDDTTVKCDAYQTVSFVIQNYMIHDGDVAKMLIESIKVGGDVDSTAALCMGLCGLKGWAIPIEMRGLVLKLENGTYGKDYIRELDKKLFKKFPSNK